ncbi:MAG: ABC transporter permease [Reichenbachiella sp.]
MNFPFFISRRVTQEDKSSYSALFSRMAVISISVGVAAIILSFFILGGFQETVKNKVYNFKGHLEITKYSFGNSFEDDYVYTNSGFLKHLDEYPFVSDVQVFASKAGMIKTSNEVEGIVLRGVGQDFERNRFDEYIREGRFFQFNDSSYSKEIMLSTYTANKLNIAVGDKVTFYFVQNPPKFRRLEVVGLYETGMEQIDKVLVMGDLGLIQKLNNWPDSIVSGFEVFIDDLGKIDEAEEVLFEGVDSNLYVEKVSDKYHQIFDWLGMLNQNVTVFLGLILVVASFNMVSILLILIMERTYMIGVLQALGTSKGQIKKVFIHTGLWLIVRGLLYGNGAAILIAFIQDYFKIIPLDPINYYMYYVPIKWDLGAMLFSNIVTLVVVGVSLYLPINVISRMKPVDSVKFN